jgi:alkaline phosphatase D
MYATWDDHETANNSYADGAGNHDSKEGDWNVRKAAARQAYFEWMPIRETFGRRVWRSFRYGDLADLTFLDTRIAGRDVQVGGPEDDGPERHILGEEQEQWVADELANANPGWEIIAQQVMVGQLVVNGAPFNMDQWDGYSSARERLFDLVEKHTEENFVVLTGDIHSSWVMELTRDPLAASYDPENDNLGVEFVVPAISSPGLDAGLEEFIGKTLDESNPHLAYRNLSQRGYMLLDVSPERVQADYFLLDGVEEGQGIQSFAVGFSAKHGDARLNKVDAPVERKSAE